MTLEAVEDQDERGEGDGVNPPPGPSTIAPAPAPVAPTLTPRARLVALTAATLALTVFLLYGPVPVRVTIDGRPSWVLRGTTPARLLRQGRLAGTPGILWSQRGAILDEHGGGAPSIHLDGVEVDDLGVPLGAGARLNTFRGPDATEPTVVRTIETTPSVRHRGSGPVESVESAGTPGRAEIVAGAISGEEVSRRVLAKGASAVIRREPAWKGPKEVALTFDDGPWPVSTDAVLAELKAARVPATFFMVGVSVKRRPEIAERVRAAGMEIGNHSLGHRLLAHASRATVRKQIRGGSNVIKRVLGVTPRWYRPAGGSTSHRVRRAAKSAHLRLVMWTVDPKDWSRPGARVIARRVLDHVKPGAVVLMHDGGGDRSQSVEALRLVIAGLKARGYSMVTLSRLHRLPGPPLPLRSSPFPVPGPLQPL